MDAQTTDIGQTLADRFSATADEARDRALDDLLAFVGENVRGTERTVTVNVHSLPVSLFEDGTFEAIQVHRRDGGAHYLSGTRMFGRRQVSGFSIDLDDAETLP